MTTNIMLQWGEQEKEGYLRFFGTCIEINLSNMY